MGSKRWLKSSVKSVRSVREKPPQHERKTYSMTFKRSFPHGGCVLFLTDNTEEQNTQHPTETLSQPISQNVTANVS